jgi:Fe-S-cluster containining protein
MGGALRGEREADVACDTCTACCSSSQFVHVEPDEVALAHIPRALLFPAPGLPAGHVLLGYDEHGRCPMLTDAGCSIYRHRPRTCRTYDCRVFPAAGVEPDDKPLVAERARRWRFDHPTPQDRTAHDAVQAAAAFVRDRGAELFDGRPPTSPTHVAVLAVELHDAFVGAGDDPAGGAVPDVAAVRVALTRSDRRRGGG